MQQPFSQSTLSKSVYLATAPNISHLNQDYYAPVFVEQQSDNYLQLNQEIEDLTYENEKLKLLI